MPIQTEYKWLNRIHHQVHVSLPIETTKAQEVCIASYLTVVSYPLKRYATNDKNETVDAVSQKFKL